ncbi:MAG: acetyltransferase [Flavobacteriaceae bacterium]|nr:acetyltransferase [Flavobacteriaceae bacterium]
MKDVIIYGAGGHCYALVDLLRSSQEFKPVLIVDDEPKDNQIMSVPVIDASEAKFDRDQPVFLAIGDNFDRKKIGDKLDANFPNLISRSATVYPSAKLGKGIQVLPGAVIDAAASLGDFVIVNNNATISHNALIGDCAHVAINVAIAGGVSIGEGTLVGSGSVILPNINIGKWATIGAGAVVTRDVPDYAVVYGNPAQIVRFERK